jgi:hypothetical protein
MSAPSSTIKREADMRGTIAAILGLAALVTTSERAASNPAHAQRRSLAETPAENVRKSQWYDHLLSTNSRFRAYRMRKECDPIVNDRELRNDCIRSFDEYEPFRPRAKSQRQ